MSINVRPGKEGDLEAINRIYNHYVAHTALTFDTEPWSAERRRAWFSDILSPYFLLVAESQGQVVGFCYNQIFKPKQAYACSSEVTVYLDPDYQGKGLGRLLYQALFERVSTTDIHRLYAWITMPNEASIALHKKWGFSHSGTMHQVGFKFGQYHDVSLWEKCIGDETHGSDLDHRCDRHHRV